jgi:glycosyltransferase involved in cell wall biosynthesis
VPSPPRVVLHAPVADDEWGESAATVLRGLLDAGLDAHVLAEGGDAGRLRGLEALPDDVLRGRVHPPPVRLRGGARPGLRLGLARAARRDPLRVVRQLGPGVAPRLRYLRAVLLALRPDVVHVATAATAHRFAATAALAGARLVVSLGGDELAIGPDDPDEWGRLWARADGVVVETAGLAELARRLGAPEGAVAVVPPRVEPAVGAVPPRDGDGRPLRVLSVGPLAWWQGLEHSLRAVRLLADRGVASDYRIVGEGEFVDALGFARHQLGLEHAVELVEPGRQPLAELLGWADVLVSPAVAPASLRPVYAALARGLPVVTTEAPAGAEEAVLSVPRRDPEAIAESLALVVRDAAVRERLSAAGRAWTASASGPEERVSALLGLYRSVLDGRP